MKTKIIHSNIILKQTNVFFDFWEGFGFKKKLKTQETVYFFQSIDDFLKVYSNIVTCLELSLHTIVYAKNDLLKVLSLVKKGVPLSKSFEVENLIPSNIVNILKVGEKNNDLPGALKLIVATLENQIERERDFWGSILYPLFILAVFFVTVMVFSRFVLPSLIDLVTELDTDLAGRFLFVNKLVFFVEKFLMLLFFCIASMFCVYRFNYELFESLFLCIPYFRSFFCYKNLSFFCFYIQASLRSGLSIESAIDLSLNSFKGIFLGVFQSIKMELAKGKELSACLVQHSLIPKFFSDIIQTGEKSNNLVGAFDSSYKIFNDKEKRFIVNFTSLMPIILISFIGFLLIFFVWFLLLPLYSLGVA